MRLKRLELFGFKSFADRTVIDFQRSLTGIVGPNGCGKSNVVDAIRWTLGEQRAKSMRGGEMTDVIFKGSSSRAGLGVAEATMVFDNSDGVIESRGAEVSITRRVYKSAEGEYLIDGERVRLKDIRDMLFDTGLGSRGYSVLEQGRIDAVLSANPLERRAIFEEAAGISRYRQRKHEAENKLKRVERDMERLDDVLRELTTRSRSLKIQAGKAERFISTRDSWREQATRYSKHRAFNLKDSLASVSEKITETEELAETLREQRTAAETEVHEFEQAQMKLAFEQERVSKSLAETGAELRALDERKSQLTVRIRAWRQSSEEECARRGELVQRLGERQAELDDLTAAVEELNRKSEEAAERLLADTQALAHIREDLDQIVRAAEEADELVLELLHDKTAAENEVIRLERTIEPLGDRLRKSTERLRETRESRELAVEADRRAREEVRLAEEHSNELESRRAHLHGEARELEDATAELAGQRTEGRLERTRIEGRIESLLDHELERERLDSGSRELVRLADAALQTEGAVESEGADGEVPTADSSRPPVERLGGLLADKLRTSTRYARALDVVLGNRAQALIVEDIDAAGEVIQWLKDQALGHARLVLPRGLSRAGFVPAPNLVRMSGVEGPLLDCVSVEPGFEQLAETLLRDVLLVESIAVAVEMVGLSPGLRCVTVEGDLVDSGGISGGHQDIVHGPVGRRSSAAELTGEIGEIERLGEELTTQLEALGQKKGELQADTQVVLTALDEARQSLGDARGTMESARMRLADLDEALRVRQTECAEIEKEQTDCEVALVASRERHGELCREFEKENALLAEYVRGRRATEAQREEFSRRESQARVESTSLSGQLEGDRRRREDLQRGCEELVEEEQRSTELALRHAADADAGEAQFEEIDGKREQYDSAKNELESEQSELRQQDQSMRESIEEQRHSAETVTRSLEEEMRKLSDRRLEDQRLELAREELLRRAEEELSLSEYDLLSEFEPEEELKDVLPIDQLGEAVSDLKRTLDKLGSVNLEAVEELEEVTERLTFLEEQRGDISRARLALLNTLRTINEESERLFLDAFEDIRKNFSGLFRQLFGGGRATIELAEGEPVLEAGIEISARPPGREMLPLGLLSGGQRTMTALALLFAVFKSRPSPFCVLDEVDAALDDANIGRFLVLLDGFRETTQFIVVTHNKGTMSSCDLLYGITMETRGVSRNVSVELSEVDEFVPEVEGNATVAQEARAETMRTAVLEDEAGDLEDGDDETGEPVVELIPVRDPGALEESEVPALETAEEPQASIEESVETAHSVTSE